MRNGQSSCKAALHIDMHFAADLLWAAPCSKQRQEDYAVGNDFRHYSGGQALSGTAWVSVPAVPLSSMGPWANC